MPKIYTSRYSNPELRSGKYTAVCISVGKPRWPLGYAVAGEIDALKPIGIFKNYTGAAFKEKYFERLERIGVEEIRRALASFMPLKKDIVLLCYEDIRKPDQVCHRTMFAEWWLKKIGEEIGELTDPSAAKGIAKNKQPANLPSQLTLF